MTVTNLIPRVLDLLLLGFCSWLAFNIQFGYVTPLEQDGERYLDATISALLIATIVLTVTLNQRVLELGPSTNLAFNVVVSWTYIFLAASFLTVIMKTSSTYSRAWFLLWISLTVVFSLVSHMGASRALTRLMLKQMDRREVVLLGSSEIWREMIEGVRKESGASVHFRGYFGTQLNEVADWAPHYLGEVSSLGKKVEQIYADEIWIFLPLRDAPKLREMLHELRHCTANVRYFPDLKGYNLINHSVSEIGGFPVINITESPFSDERKVIKRIEDIILSLIILILLSPVMAVVAIMVKLSSPGPILYRQERLSWGGRSFEMLKFRSMPVDAEVNTGAVWAKPNEQRATRIGSFLRKTSLDELPQFLNVLKGDMSIVGPRPERPVFVERFKNEIPDYMKKHMVKGGITGWAQVNGFRGDTSLEKRIESDIYYINNWSLLLDIRIILRTILVALKDDNAY